MIIFKEEIPLGFHGAWLQGVRKEVFNSGHTHFGVPRYMGKTTGYFTRDINIPVKKLIQIVQSVREQGDPEQNKPSNLLQRTHDQSNKRFL